MTVPVLDDTETETIVNNESADIARMLNQAFDEYATKEVTLYPEGYRDEIGTITGTIRTDINSGVYRAGFADSQRSTNRQLRICSQQLRRRIAPLL